MHLLPLLFTCILCSRIIPVLVPTRNILMYPYLFAIIIALHTLDSPVFTSERLTIDSAAPVVLRTIPAAGTRAVDPTTRQIHVQFSKIMDTMSWSWVEVHPEQFPEVTGKPHYLADQTTCVLPVALKANTTYAIWINTSRFNHFRDNQRKPAIPYLLVFRTTTLQH